MSVSYNKLWKLLIDKNMKKKELGEAAGLKVGTASACIIDAGEGQELVNEIVEKIAELKN